MVRNKPDISIVIVNYRVKELVALLIKSLEEASNNLKTEIIVIDNYPEDNAGDYFKKLYSDIHVIENHQNVGFAKANNQGINQSKGEYIYIVNPDVIVRNDSLSVFKKFLDENPDYGAVGCKIINPDGSFARECKRSDPDLKSAIYRVLNIDTKFPENKNFGKRYLGWIKEDNSADVPVISGAGMFCRADVLKDIDGFDESFFMYGEDDDLCLRIRKEGFKIRYLPDTTILHFKGESQKITTFKQVKKIQSGLYRYFEKHYKKQYSFLTRLIVKAFFNLKIWFNYSAEKIKKERPLKSLSTKTVLISERKKDELRIVINKKRTNEDIVIKSPSKTAEYLDQIDTEIVFDIHSVSFKEIFQIMESNRNLKQGNYKFLMNDLILGKQEP